MAYYVVPLHLSITQVLASTLINETIENPIHLAQYHLYLSSKRLGRALLQEILDLHPQKATFLPQFYPLTPQENSSSRPPEVLPPLSPLLKQALLTNLILKWQSTKGLPSLSLALKITRSLTPLLDDLLQAQVSAEELQSIVPEEFASHWGNNLEFLSILVNNWPQIVEEAGYQDPVLYKMQNFSLRLQEFTVSPPQNPLLAVAPLNPTDQELAFLKLLANLPNGRVIIFGVDCLLGDSAWEALPSTHPQASIGRLFKRLELKPSSLPLWQ